MRAEMTLEAVSLELIQHERCCVYVEASLVRIKVEVALSLTAYLSPAQKL